jgi:Bifunctional DNA primase/polymerase, N-terminal
MFPDFEGAPQAALALAKNCRYAVFPCNERKVPVRPKSEGGRGFHDASRDPDEIIELWRRWPGPLVGIRTDAASGICVLDLDCKHPEACAWWRRYQSKIPLTRLYRTRSGGMHAYFADSNASRPPVTI